MFLLGLTLSQLKKLNQAMSEASTNATRLDENRLSSQRSLVNLFSNLEEVEKVLEELKQPYQNEQAILSEIQKSISATNSAYNSTSRVSKINLEWTIKTYFLVITEVQWRKNLSSAIEDLLKKIAVLKQAIEDLNSLLVNYVLDLMPIPLSQKTMNQVSYEQVRKNPQASIQIVFALFEDHLRLKLGVGPEVYGQTLINSAFGKNGHLVYSKIPSEQDGIRNLMSGAYAVFRNSRMHRIMEDDEDTALIIISLIDLMMKIVDEV